MLASSVTRVCTSIISGGIGVAVGVAVGVNVAVGVAVRVGVAVFVGVGVAIGVGEGLAVGAKAGDTNVGVCDDWAGGDTTFGSEGGDVPDVGEGNGDTGAETARGEAV